MQSRRSQLVSNRFPVVRLCRRLDRPSAQLLPNITDPESGLSPSNLPAKIDAGLHMDQFARESGHFFRLREGDASQKEMSLELVEIPICRP
jgi:hypothetical protein